jgi:hypothetical protein
MTQVEGNVPTTSNLPSEQDEQVVFITHIMYLFTNQALGEIQVVVLVG